MPPGTRVTILGVEIDAVTMEEAVEAFRRLIARGRAALACNINVDICMRIQRDAQLRQIFRTADLVLVDGTPMMWAARFLGRPLPGRVSGSDFVPFFCRAAAREGFRIFLLGGEPGVADRAKRCLQARSPVPAIVGTYAPPIGFDRDEHETARVIAMIRRARPDVLFAAFGSPKQEKWLFRFRDALQVPVSMGIGSTFDYLAGRLRRAPAWMQRAGLEWTYRLAQEPRRLWRRYLLDDPPFVYHIIRQRLMERPVHTVEGGASVR